MSIPRGELDTCVENKINQGHEIIDCELTVSSLLFFVAQLLSTPNPCRRATSSEAVSRSEGGNKPEKKKWEAVDSFALSGDNKTVSEGNFINQLNLSNLSRFNHKQWKITPFFNPIR